MISRSASSVLGVTTGSLAVLVALDYVRAWPSHELLRQHLSEVEYFSATAVWVVVGLAEVGFSLSPPSTLRAGALTAISVILVLNGARASAALDLVGLRFFYVGLVGVLAAVPALLGIRRRLAAGGGGILAALVALAVIYTSSALISEWFP